MSMSDVYMFGALCLIDNVENVCRFNAHTNRTNCTAYTPKMKWNQWAKHKFCDTECQRPKQKWIHSRECWKWLEKTVYEVDTKKLQQWANITYTQTQKRIHREMLEIDLIWTGKKPTKENGKRNENNEKKSYERKKTTEWATAAH